MLRLSIPQQQIKTQILHYSIPSIIRTANEDCINFLIISGEYTQSQVEHIENSMRNIHI